MLPDWDSPEDGVAPGRLSARRRCDLVSMHSSAAYITLFMSVGLGRREIEEIPFRNQEFLFEPFGTSKYNLLREWYVAGCEHRMGDSTCPKDPYKSMSQE